MRGGENFMVHKLMVLVGILVSSSFVHAADCTSSINGSWHLGGGFSNDLTLNSDCSFGERLVFGTSDCQFSGTYELPDSNGDLSMTYSKVSSDCAYLPINEKFYCGTDIKDDSLTLKANCGVHDVTAIFSRK
jgi:hypothetical protein